jgi:rRNA maturation endonuclease Nob1
MEREMWYSCEKCNAEYDNIDYEEQACSVCGWDSIDQRYNPLIIKINR